MEYDGGSNNNNYNNPDPKKAAKKQVRKPMENNLKSEPNRMVGFGGEFGEDLKVYLWIINQMEVD